MSYNINTAVISGNCVQDPDVKYLANENCVAKFTLAVNQGTGDKERANYIDCTAWGKTAELMQKYVKKGQAIAVEGSLKQERWESQDGQKRSKVTVTAFRVHFLGKRGDGRTERREEMPVQAPKADTSADEPPF